MKEVLLTEDMIYEALVIIKSVEWVERKMKRKIAEVDALPENVSTEVRSKLEKDIVGLLLRLRLEEIRMVTYMAKYRKLIANEKEKVLHDLWQGEEVHLRGVPKDARRPSKGQGLPRPTHKRASHEVYD